MRTRKKLYSIITERTGKSVEQIERVAKSR